MKKIPLILLLVCFAGSALLGAGNVLFFNNIARPMGMGGAFTGVEDSLQTHLYNPAAAAFPARGAEADAGGFGISFDLVRGVYIFLMILSASDYVAASDDSDLLGGIALLSLALSTANISYTSESWFFKLNFMDQLVNQGADFPMYSTSATLAYRFRGPLTGFQTGITGHLYNLGSDSLPQGASVSWGLYYRSRPRSPFSLGLFYFHASDDMPWVRKPFEQIMNNTFNFGAAYEVADRFTLSFDLRNINNFNLDAYLQPHFGLEKIFVIGRQGEGHMTLALRAGAYYDSETKEVGYSGGFDWRLYWPDNRHSALSRGNSGYLYAAYTLTREEKVAAYDRILKYNHIISIGMVF